MATFSDLGAIAGNSNFQSRIQYAMMVAAVNVYAEAAETDAHRVRKDFAQKVFSGNVNWQSICLMVLTNSSIAAEANLATTPGFAIPDSDIQFAVNSLWNDFAGV